MLPPLLRGAFHDKVTDSLVISLANKSIGAEGLSKTITDTVAVFDPALFSSVNVYFPE